MLETMPIGVVLAEAPSGHISLGDLRSKEMVKHPVYTSKDVESHEKWTSFHENCRPVESHEYPLAKVIGEGERTQSSTWTTDAATALAFGYGSSAVPCLPVMARCDGCDDRHQQ